MKVAILYICTGRYELFWKGFHEAAERLLFVDSEKTYFVFTDSPRILSDAENHVEVIVQQRLGWPYDTLLRFEMFEKVLHLLSRFDFAVFINSNMVPVERIPESILPSAENEGLFVTLHPGFYNISDNEKYTYERNPASLAYIPIGEGQHYYMGGFNGGSVTAYGSMISSLAKAIRMDLSKNIIAQWHDESHLNKYMLKRSPKILDPSYGFPQGWKLPFSPRMLILDKTKYGGHSYLRGEARFPENTLAGRALNRIVRIVASETTSKK